MVVDKLRDSFEILKEPTLAVKKKSKANLGDGIMLLAVAGALGGAVMGFLGALFTGNLLGIIFASPSGLVGGAIGLPVVMLISNGLIYLVASKVFKGTATFVQQFYLVALPTASCLVILMAIAAIPFVGLLSGLLSLYLAYVQIIVVRDAHGLDIVKAVVSVLLPTVVFGFLAMLVAGALVLALLGGAFFSAASGAAGG